MRSRADRATVHQQVLHPRPAAGKLLRPILRWTGHHVHGVVANVGRGVERATWMTTPRDGAPPSTRPWNHGACRQHARTAWGDPARSTPPSCRGARAGERNPPRHHVDLSNVGEIGVNIDEDYVARCEEQYRDGGPVRPQLAHAFATLRANESIWYFHVSNYLKGTMPAAFDLLFWNSDSPTCRADSMPVPGATLTADNPRTPARVVVLGRPVDLGASAHRPTCSPPVRTISCRGPRPMRGSACLAVESSLCLEQAVMWQAWSTRRIPRAGASGTQGRRRGRPAIGWRGLSANRAAGGRTGAHGCGSTPASRCAHRRRLIRALRTARGGTRALRVGEQLGWLQGTA